MNKICFPGEGAAPWQAQHRSAATAPQLLLGKPAGLTQHRDLTHSNIFCKKWKKRCYHLFGGLPKHMLWFTARSPGAHGDRCPGVRGAASPLRVPGDGSRGAGQGQPH